MVENCCPIFKKIAEITHILDFIDQDEEVSLYEKYISMLKKYLKIYYDNNM